MYPVSNPLSQGLGTQQLDRLSQNPTERMPSRPGPDVFAARPNRVPMDDVLISDRARGFVASGPVEIPPPGEGGGDNDLLKAARLVNSFLEEHPRIANSPFGKSAGMLVRGAVHLAKGDGTDGLPQESQEQLMQAVGKVKEFLGNHPRVADSPFGQAVAKLGGEIASHIRADNGDPGPTLQDKVIHAARQAHGFLESNPKIAEMPLGQAVEKLINGVGEMGDAGTIDAEIQQLAKRIGNFVHNHPRPAQSEFGQLVSNLTRGMLALDTTLPPAIDPPVVGDVRPGIGRVETNVRSFDVPRPVITDVTPARIGDGFLKAESDKAA